jgi:hypothetical protein
MNSQFSKESKRASRKWRHLHRAQDFEQGGGAKGIYLLHTSWDENNLVNKPEQIHNVNQTGPPLNTRTTTVIRKRGNRDGVAITNKETGET